MKLLRIKIEQVRQFRKPFELSGLESGLNLFTGPNEAGKSTVVRAIRAAFFERHRSSSVDDLLPWGDSAATPTVEVDFSIDDKIFKLRKSFLKKGRCELAKQDGALDGEAAEHYLAELLGFEFPGRGASKAEHWGIPGLLWIEQGTGQDIADSVSHATDHLRKALDRSVNEVSSELGDEVITKISKQRDALLTPNGRPRSAYVDAIAAHTAFNERLAEMDLRIDQYQRQVDQLGNLLIDDAADKLAKPWESLRNEQAQAESQLVLILALKEQLDADLMAMAQLKEKQHLIDDQLESFELQRRDLQLRESTLATILATVETQQSSSERWSEKSNAADTSYRLATEALAIARQEDLRGDLHAKVLQAATSAASISLVVDSAVGEQENLEGFRKLARATLLTSADMKLLRAQQATLNEIGIRRNVAATRMRFALLPGIQMTQGTQDFSGAGEILITQPTKLHFAGIGELDISPGGADLSDLMREEDELLGEQQALFQRLGISSLPDAELRFAQHQQANSDAKHAEKSLSMLAPRGIDLLRQELVEQRSKQEGAQSRLDQLPTEPVQTALALPKAIELHTLASEHRDQIAQDTSKAMLELVATRERGEGALRERDALLILLGGAERQTRQRDINQAALNSRAQHDALQVRVSMRQSEVDSARPDILSQDAERLKRSADQCERLFRERQMNITVLRSRLEEAGAHGLEEERAEIKTSADAAERRLSEIKLRAEALDLLVTLLEAKRADLTKKIQAPLQKHIQAYLQLLFPRATLEIGEDLTPGRLTRIGQYGAEGGHLAEMSYGAREQMGVISRLAYADLLKEAGRPTLIILDDALVHTDAQRLEQMKRVIFDASKRHQILVFTCHPAAWRNVGASPIAISRDSVH